MKRKLPVVLTSKVNRRPDETDNEWRLIIQKVVLLFLRDNYRFWLTCTTVKDPHSRVHSCVISDNILSISENSMWNFKRLIIP